MSDRVIDGLGSVASADFKASLGARLAEAAARVAPTTLVDAARIGVIADTHCERADQLPPAAAHALDGVDLIIHCGDIGTRGLLERLRQIAPVFAVRSPMDEPADDIVLFDGPRIIGVGDRCIGVVSHAEDADLADGASAIFGASVDFVVSGTTHVAKVRVLGGLVALDPGSPTLPMEGNAPTIGLLELGERVSARVIELEEA